MWFLQPGMTLQGAIMVIVALLITIFFIMPIHEWAHGFVAYKLGDSTAKDSGRLTLNPLKHIDPLGAASMILFRVGWARPVPVDSRNFKRPKLGMALTAVAGPLSNLIVATVSACIFYSVVLFGGVSPKSDLFGYFSMISYAFIDINVALAVFNLLPIPPLDGSKILAIFLPNKLLQKYYQYEQYIELAVFILLFAGVLSVPLHFLNELVLEGISKVVSNLYRFVLLLACDLVNRF